MDPHKWLIRNALHVQTTLGWFEVLFSSGRAELYLFPPPKSSMERSCSPWLTAGVCEVCAGVCVVGKMVLGAEMLPNRSRPGSGAWQQETNQKMRGSVISLLTSVSPNGFVCPTCKDVHWPDNSSNFGLFGTEGGSFSPENKIAFMHVILHIN